MACVSSKGAYGLAAMLYLAQHADKLIQIRDIAKNGGIPQNYLEQLLVQLKKNGFVESTRGAGGGYRLAMEPKDITIYQILEALEGELCANRYDVDNKALEFFWDDIRRKIQEVFGQTLADLVDLSEKMESNTMYYI
ncbi:Rrf2 family transcriptional regulator [Desulfurispirillum indicum]|uniref:Transcriptional regulator, Rrf2 family n=1 Tax=Desulfurispirillum indicum (strain ATCC BAA-1389 / DSM 22839 / S5) TaxID=653733 RepID=E6W325_DESIS|nr:Rrf2 family transcriptional regulator [Desulfurispirillum indicum]ADU65686.1 transcriptional regulator, Rrf2 family [Desulfurispirillum indicum S5]UCZ57475.1 Rrf2 family transcriptional regulator [Desulfurispirillum indicum]